MTTTFTWSSVFIPHAVSKSITEGTMDFPFHWNLKAVSDKKPNLFVDTMGFVTLTLPWNQPNPPMDQLIPMIQDKLGSDFIAKTKNELETRLNNLT